MAMVPFESHTARRSFGLHCLGPALGLKVYLAEEFLSIFLSVLWIAQPGEILISDSPMNKNLPSALKSFDGTINVPRLN